jgi:hypothetical protein
VPDDLDYQDVLREIPEFCGGLVVETSEKLPEGAALVLHPTDVTDEMHCHTEEELARFRSLRCKALTVISTAGQRARDPSTVVNGDPVAAALARRRKRAQAEPL